jgi:hypothetical protein
MPVMLPGCCRTSVEMACFQWRPGEPLADETALREVPDEEASEA